MRMTMGGDGDERRGPRTILNCVSLKKKSIKSCVEKKKPTRFLSPDPYGAFSQISRTSLFQTAVTGVVQVLCTVVTKTTEWRSQCSKNGHSFGAPSAPPGEDRTSWLETRHEFILWMQKRGNNPNSGRTPSFQRSPGNSNTFVPTTTTTKMVTVFLGRKGILLTEFMHQEP